MSTTDRYDIYAPSTRPCASSRPTRCSAWAGWTWDDPQDLLLGLAQLDALLDAP